MVASRTLYVSGYPPSVNEVDLSELMGKMLTVTHIYIPGPTPTGLTRPFAMVSVSSETDSSITSCARKLNNSFWKGGRLRVEPARVHYVDRLANEKYNSIVRGVPSNSGVSSISEHTISGSSPNSEVHVTDGGNMHKQFLPYLRLLRRPGLHLYVSCDSQSPLEFVERGLSKYPILSRGKHLRKSSESEDLIDVLAVKSSKTETSDLISPSNHTPTIATPIYGNLAPLKETSESFSKKRVGFGFGQEKSATAKDPESVDSSYFENGDSGGKSLEQPGRLVDVYDRNDEFAAGDDEIELATQDEHIPCVFEEELQETFLIAERERARSIFADLSGESRRDADRDTEMKTTSSRFKSTYGWDGVQAPLRFDPSVADKGVFLLNPEEKHALLQKNSGRESEQVREHNSERTSDSVQNSDEGNHASEANLGELKGIFGKNDGVWFDEANNIKEEVRRGDDHDDIFLAAERRGIDVRSGEREQITFGFFEDSTGSPPLENTVFSNSANSVNVPATISQFSTELPSILRESDPVNYKCGITSIFAIARKFVRSGEITEQQIILNWKNSRAREISSYKRKVQDLKRMNKRRRSGGKDMMLDPEVSQPTTFRKETSTMILKRRGGRRGQGRQKTRSFII